MQLDFHHVVDKLASSVVQYVESRSSAPWNFHIPQIKLPQFEKERPTSYEVKLESKDCPKTKKPEEESY